MRSVESVMHINVDLAEIFLLSDFFNNTIVKAIMYLPVAERPKISGSWKLHSS